MTESNVDVITPITSELKRDSRLVVLLGSPEVTRTTSKKLSACPDVERIGRGLYIVHGYSENHSNAIQSQSLISFIKTKEIPNFRKKEEDVHSNRAFVIVSFSFKNPTAQQKKRVERLIRKSTGVRLRPGVILFPLFRAKERRRIIGTEENRILIDSKEFSRLVREVGGNSIRWSRLKIKNLNGSNHVRNAIENTFIRDLRALEDKIRNLREQSKDTAITLSQLKKNYGLLSRSFRELKTKWLLAKKLWFYDAEKALKRIYNILINTRRIISFEETRRMN
ncbi:MAG: hypothetical protein ACXAEF_02320 [Candidatus Thorarchaeota archaeon]|jgi:hypothetical protein